MTPIPVIVVEKPHTFTSTYRKSVRLLPLTQPQWLCEGFGTTLFYLGDVTDLQMLSDHPQL